MNKKCCGECNVQLVARIKIIILKQSVPEIDDLIVTEAFDINSASSHSNINEEDLYEGGGYAVYGRNYHYQPVGATEGGNIQTDKSISIEFSL